MIELKNVSYTYPAPSKTAALVSVSAVIKSGTVTAVTGHTGSGKSTLMEILAGITEPERGTVAYNGTPIKDCRSRIGIVFQYPEYQLFADTVYDDIAYGPKNLGLKGAELEGRVRDAAVAVGLKDELMAAAPFELSGGEKRLAALAGILAMQPSILLLDEPAAGLDPKGRQHMFSIIRALISDDPEMTIVFVTHSMEDAAENAEDIIVLSNGSIAAHGAPGEIFRNTELLAQCGLDMPPAAQLAKELKSLGIDIGDVYTTDAAYEAVCRILENT